MVRLLKCSAFVVAGLFLVLDGDRPVQAFGRRHHHSSGSYGSCGSSGGSCGSWGSYGSCGSSGGSCGSSGGSCGSSGGSCGSWGSYGSCGSSGGSCGSSGGHHHYPPAPAAPATTSVLRPADLKVTLELNVPADAVVYLMNQKMTITGPIRRYSIPLTNATSTYDYPVRVELVTEGKMW